MIIYITSIQRWQMTKKKKKKDDKKITHPKIKIYNKANVMNMSRAHAHGWWPKTNTNKEAAEETLWCSNKRHGIPSYKNYITYKCFFRVWTTPTRTKQNSGHMMPVSPGPSDSVDLRLGSSVQLQPLRYGAASLHHRWIFVQKRREPLHLLENGIHQQFLLSTDVSYT